MQWPYPMNTNMTTNENVSSLCRAVEAIVGHGDGDEIRVVVDHAIADGVTDPREIAEIVREARADHAAEVEFDD